MHDFEQIVDCHYATLYRFALSLAKNGAEAADLTQETFYLWASRGYQLRDFSKVKSWLFTTLYRAYLSTYRHAKKFPHIELEDAIAELPSVAPSIVADLDGTTVVEALTQVDEIFRVPLTLFYLQDLSYREIAEILEVPIGTVMSRLSRGKAQLRESLLEARGSAAGKVIPLPGVERKGGVA